MNEPICTCNRLSSEVPHLPGCPAAPDQPPSAASETGTPLTDAKEWWTRSNVAEEGVVFADLARTLERELNKAVAGRSDANKPSRLLGEELQRLNAELSLQRAAAQEQARELAASEARVKNMEKALSLVGSFIDGLTQNDIIPHDDKELVALTAAIEATK